MNSNDNIPNGVERFKGALYGVSVTLPIAYIDNHMMRFGANQIERVYGLLGDTVSQYLGSADNAVLIGAGLVGAVSGSAFPKMSEYVSRGGYGRLRDGIYKLFRLAREHTPMIVDKGRNVMAERRRKPSRPPFINEPRKSENKPSRLDIEDIDFFEDLE